MTVGPFTRKTDLVDLVRAQDINELQIACEDLQDQILSHTHDASKITSGTLSTDRFSAYADLQAEGKIGLGDISRLLRGLDQRVGVVIGRNDANGSQYLTTNSSVWSVVPFNAVLFDYPPEGYANHWTSGNDYITIRVSGLYFLFGTVSWTGDVATGRRLICFDLSNDGTGRFYINANYPNGVYASHPAFVVGVAPLQAGDTLCLACYQDSGQNLNLVTYATDPDASGRITINQTPLFGAILLAPI